jgi:oligopeptide transport system substrate-binding protein
MTPAFRMVCEANADNQQFGITFKGRVEGAEEYYQSTIEKKPLAGGVSGVKVINDHTLQVVLKHPFAGFLNILTMPGCWLYPKEAVAKYGSDIRVNCIGTGAFQIKNLKEGDAVVLERNKNYWAVDDNGNQLPFLDGLKYSFIKDKKSELYEFKKGNLDMTFRLPIEMIPDILDEFNHAKEGNARFDMMVVPGMGLDYYGFQNQSEIFGKKNVRLAFNYAINREKLVTYTLQGDGIPASYGIVPPSFKGYDHKLIRGFTFKPDTAQKLLAEAGYPNGKGFPKLTLQINSGGERNVQVAEVIQKMLKENLNVDVDINVMPMAEHMENFETGKALFWRTSWIADYPDPETFLTVLYGKHVPEKLTERSYVNSVRYKSAKFDSLFELALGEIDTKKRFDLYRQADQVAIDDAAIMPIFYHENYRLVQLWVKNCEANAMEYRDMSKVYFIPKEEVKKP